MADIDDLDDPFGEKPPPKPVWQAAEEENLDEVREAVENKEDINRPNPITLNTPLLIAVKTNNMEMAKFLLSKGADVKMQNTLGDSALHWAALRGEEDMVKTMISRGANVNAAGEYGNTPLHLACSGNHTGVVSILLQEGALVHCRNDYGNTPLFMTIDSEIQQMVRTVMTGGEAGREQVKSNVLKKLERKRKAQEQECLRQQVDYIEAIVEKRREQEEYDRSQREAILAEERRIEEEDAARECAEAEERQRQEEARLEAERLEVERLKAEKKQKKYEKWLAKMKKKNPGFVDPKAAKAAKGAKKK